MPAGPKEFVQSPELLARTFTRGEALGYTRWLATSHYENFHVVSFLLPKRLHQDFYNVYAFCRWADDLGDEIGDPAESLRLLGWWRAGLHAMFAGEAVGHPVYVALRETAAKYSMTAEPFDNLITAFERDQTITRFARWDDVLDYCVYSANPVGRLVLQLCGYTDDERRRLSDATCTALQLANFWQDVTVDLLKDRVYLPVDVLARHGSSLDEVTARRFTPQFREAMREAVDVAERLFQQGLPLIRTVDRRLAVDLELFSRGGMRVLSKIRALDYNVLGQRPKIGKVERAGLLFGALARTLLRAA